MTSSDHSSVINRFPIQQPPPIIGEPTYESINILVQSLYANAASIPSDLGGSAHGHLGLIMSPTLYAMLTTTPFTIPDDPGQTPDYPTGRLTTEERTMYKDEHHEELHHYKLQRDVEAAQKSQLIGAAQQSYWEVKRHKHTGFLTSTTRDIIQHLLDTYGRITPTALAENLKRFQQPIDPTISLELYYKALEDAMQYAYDGGSPLS